MNALGDTQMAEVKEIPSHMLLPPELQHLRVAAYCRVSTEHEEQDGSLKLQENHYKRLIDDNPNWENAGIFSEKATGLNIEERKAFKTMLRACRKGEIDLILTKSISRFGRNTLDMLKALRELHNLGIDVYFEIDNLWLHGQHLQMLLATYCAIAQAESEDMSRNIKWGIKRGFQSGSSGYSDFVCFGYKRDDNGKLEIDEPTAKIVRMIFQLRANGKSLGAISNWLYESKIKSPTGKERWSRETISKLLKNEKYVGDVMLQKTFVKDMFSGKQIRNSGELDRYLIQDHHPAIVGRNLFEEVQP